MKMDYLIMTEAGVILAEQIENGMDENLERCGRYAENAQDLQKDEQQGDRRA